MANLKNSFDPPKAISFQIQLYCFPSDMLWVAALAYRVVASTFFAQISLFFIVESAFYSFFAPAFRAFKFFIHVSILHCVSDFSNARKTYCYSKSLQMIKYSLLLFILGDFIEYMNASLQEVKRKESRYLKSSLVFVFGYR